MVVSHGGEVYGWVVSPLARGGTAAHDRQPRQSRAPRSPVFVVCVLDPVCYMLVVEIYSLGGFISVSSIGKGNVYRGTGSEIVLYSVVSSAPVVTWGGEYEGSFVWDYWVRKIWWF